ncbi:hypothetical protein BJF90_30730 [Pseudonocardia sp. CNS-004]|nr:hypothetical protein BJF90_30730 [Pseudonocardia sp. CNS-004]
MSEARVLVGVTLLPLALAVPAVWMALTPGLLPFAALLTFGSVLAAWARMPLNRWVEGATGASLNNTAKAGTIALGGAVSAEVLGGYSTLVTDRAAAGLPYADLVAAANLQLALLVIPVVLVPAVLAYLTAKLRLGTLDELRAALEGGGLDRAAANTITAKLSARGLNDIGSIDALFRSTAWTPRILTRSRLGAAETRRRSVGLTGDEHAHLIAALERFVRPSAQAGPSGADATKTGTWLRRRARSPPPGPRPQRAATAADLDRIRDEALAHPAGTGLVLAPPGDGLRAFGIELRAAPGEVVLVMHADADGFVYPAADADVRVSAAQVSELVAALLPGTAGRQLNVCGCSVAADPEAGMRELALHLGMPVVAPRSTVRVHRPGRHGARVSTDGGWLRVDGDRPAESVPGPVACCDRDRRRVRSGSGRPGFACPSRRVRRRSRPAGHRSGPASGPSRPHPPSGRRSSTASWMSAGGRSCGSCARTPICVPSSARSPRRSCSGGRTRSPASCSRISVRVSSRISPPARVRRAAERRGLRRPQRREEGHALRARLPRRGSGGRARPIREREDEPGEVRVLQGPRRGPRPGLQAGARRRGRRAPGRARTGRETGLTG